jgi:hypothetical protein
VVWGVERIDKEIREKGQEEKSKEILQKTYLVFFFFLSILAPLLIVLFRKP